MIPLGFFAAGGPLVLPVGARIAMLGDSRVQNGNSVGSDTYVISHGPVGDYQVAWALDPRWHFPDIWKVASDGPYSNLHGAPRGVSGDMSDASDATHRGFKQRVADVVAMRPDFCIVEGPTNDPINSRDWTYTGPNLAAVWAGLRAANIPLAQTNIWGWPTGIGYDSQSAIRAATNTSLAPALTAAGIDLIDSAAAYDDGLGGGFSPAKYFAGGPGGGVHEGPIGAYWGGKKMAAYLQGRVAPGHWPKSAVWLPTTNKLSNGYLTGNAGSISASTGTTGVVPTGWQVAGPASPGSYCVCSIESNSETGGQTLVLTFTAGGTAASEVWTVRPYSGGALSFPGVAEYKSLGFECAINGSGYFISQLRANFSTIDGADAYHKASDAYLVGNTPGDPDPAWAARNLYCAAVPFAADATYSQPLLAITLTPNGFSGQSAVVRIKQGWFGGVADPRIAWNKAGDA